ncbi:MAG: hypothetical protein AAF499_11775, partial [Pseudomonadota bacterium]
MNRTLAAARRIAFATSTVMATFSVSPSSHALALGNIDVLSGLNQPLRAVVPLHFEEGEAPENLVLDIAGDADAVKLGALPNLLGQELGVVISLQGDRVEALITTEFPVKEPHLDVVLRTHMGETKHHRVYPVLLDLPSAFFEPDPNENYDVPVFSDRTLWNGKPSEQQADQMKVPAEVDSLEVNGAPSTPIAVGGLPPTGYEDPYDATVSLSAENEEAEIEARNFDNIESAAVDLSPSAEQIGTVRPEAVDTSTLAEVEVDDSAGAVLPTAGIDESLENLAAPQSETQVAALDTAYAQDDEIEDFARHPSLKTWSLSEKDPAAETQAANPAVQDWASTDAKLPLPEA